MGLCDRRRPTPLIAHMAGAPGAWPRPTRPRRALGAGVRPSVLPPCAPEAPVAVSSSPARPAAGSGDERRGRGLAGTRGCAWRVLHPGGRLGTPGTERHVFSLTLGLLPKVPLPPSSGAGACRPRARCVLTRVSQWEGVCSVSSPGPGKPIRRCPRHSRLRAIGSFDGKEKSHFREKAFETELLPIGERQ